MSVYEIGKEIQELRHRIEALERGSKREAATTSGPWWEDEPDVDRQAFGIVFHLRGEKWVVDRTLTGSPAESAGVQKGDVIHEVGGRSIGSLLRPISLTATIELLQSDIDHNIGFLRGEEQVVKVMRPRVLRELLVEDAKRGGINKSTCYRCRGCRSAISGVSNCPGDCPGFNCTIG